MGMQVNSGNGAKFYNINAKEGCFQFTDNGQKTKTPPGKAKLSGVLTGIYHKDDEFEGQASIKVTLVLADTTAGQPDQHVTSTLWTAGNETSGFALKLLAAANGAKVGEPITIMPWMIEAGTQMADGKPAEKNLTGTTVYQGGHKVTPVFGVDAKGQPITALEPLQYVKVGSKEIPNKEPWTAISEHLMASIKAKLHPVAADGDAADEEINPAQAASEASGHAAPRAR